MYFSAMSMRVHVCVCVCVCVHLCALAHMHVRMCFHVFFNGSMCAYARNLMHVRVCVHMLCMIMFINVFVCLIIYY